MPKAKKQPRLHPELAAAKRRPANHAAAWAKAAKQYAGNLQALPALHVKASGVPGPGPTTLPGPSKALGKPVATRVPHRLSEAVMTPPRRVTFASKKGVKTFVVGSHAKPQRSKGKEHAMR